MLDAQPIIGLDNTADAPDGVIPVRCGRMSGPWIVCQTHPQAERWAAGNVVRIGYQSYLPLVATRRRDRVVPTLWHNIEVPLFSGYLFVLLGHNPWTPIRYCPGISHIILTSRRHGYPDRVPAGIVEALMATDQERRTIQPPTSSWAPGAACRLASGPFEGHDAAVVETTAGGLVLVGVMMFGCLRTVAVRPDQLTRRD